MAACQLAGPVTEFASIKKYLRGKKLKVIIEHAIHRLTLSQPVNIGPSLNVLTKYQPIFSIPP